MTTYREQQEAWEEQHLRRNAKKSKNAERWKKETPDIYRTEYQRDVGRILYSNPFRRLRMKTQIFKASGLEQHNRTRLTHSLEVSQIAKSISRPLQLNLDLTEAIALGHDLGHTPYGHAGETALKKCLSGMTFHHNAQSVWILRTTLCNRLDNATGEPYPGFNLTHNVVEGILKHTNCSGTINELNQIDRYAPGKPASLEGQVVNIADGIAYLKHDIDDGIRNGLITKDEFKVLWNSLTDIPFDHNWIDHLIYDVISNSQNRDHISFSSDFLKVYDTIKGHIYSEIICSPMVVATDQEGIEKICTIFDYCINNPEFILRKNRKINQYKLDKFGAERMVVDYIQWLGDENADLAYMNIINNLSPDTVSDDFDNYYEEKMTV
ncbi:deoxyguanosinetriphosphate triphosphohydrolase, putative [Desulfitobacterium dehalogenans ATCC 51507]|uniref:Deoxyguanosinetriphosphate triphosphohydrolase, putative n=1 Tax=Desulfitobacterium dehalogenans (strain ATCC 51507 / DSM 9161 / JW/IU-DC1) TaxID=756499 RepID=I4AC23_DESDJ|nr:dNTP triphosphohydrolase [Desulfitobacterium dehalogenans]AFM01508.1 deoxyguanosinetriphosphate triphosphohydrolase, putative [Desulfitobacterium dehalogenans ATCC 51507]